MWARKLGLIAMAVYGASAWAGNTATQTVTYAVSAINEISVTGDPEALTVNSATAGSEPDEVSSTTRTYSITTNETKKITAELDSAMPGGVTLKVALQAPTGGTSTGDTTLDAKAVDVVTGVSQVAESGLSITYKLSATVAAGVVRSATKTITFTIAAP